MLTYQGREDTGGDLSEGVQRHDQSAGPEQPVTRGVLGAKLVIEEGGDSLQMGFVIASPVAPGEEAASGHSLRIQKPKS